MKSKNFRTFKERQSQRIGLNEKKKNSVARQPKPAGTCGPDMASEDEKAKKKAVPSGSRQIPMHSRKSQKMIPNWGYYVYDYLANACGKKLLMR